MNRLIIRHFIPAADSGVRCVPCEETSGYLQSMMESLAPKLVNLDISRASEPGRSMSHRSKLRQTELYFLLRTGIGA